MQCTRVALYVMSRCICPSVCLCVCPSVCHIHVLYWDSWTYQLPVCALLYPGSPVFLHWRPWWKSSSLTLKYKWAMKNLQFLPSISEMTHSVYYKMQIGRRDLSKGNISNDL